MKFSDHVNYLCKRTVRQLNAVRRVARYLKKDCLMTLFYAFVMSNFSYCSTVWHFCPKASTLKMEKLQKAALRVVFNDYIAGYCQLLAMSNRSPLYVSRLKTILTEVFKCIRKLNPMFMNNIFSINDKPYDTRSGQTLSQARMKTIKYGINSFTYQGAKHWNVLPADMKDIECLNEFKSCLKKWISPECHCGCCVACTVKNM